MASQATAYKIGMRKILNLRERAKESLGTDSTSGCSMTWSFVADPYRSLFWKR